MALMSPARKSTTVCSAPTTIGGEKLRANFRPGLEKSAICATPALRAIAPTAIVKERRPPQAKLQASVYMCLPRGSITPPGAAKSCCDYSLFFFILSRALKCKVNDAQLETVLAPVGVRSSIHPPPVRFPLTLLCNQGSVKEAIEIVKHLRPLIWHRESPRSQTTRVGARGLSLALRLLWGIKISRAAETRRYRRVSVHYRHTGRGAGPTPQAAPRSFCVCIATPSLPSSHSRLRSHLPIPWPAHSGRHS
jgi:hypothetical protein